MIACLTPRREEPVNGLVHFVFRYGSRFRRAWRVFWIDPEYGAEQLVQPNANITRKSQPTGNDDARQAVAASDSMVNSSESNIHNVFVKPRRYDPVGEGDLTVERVNDFGALRGRQIFFR